MIIRQSTIETVLPAAKTKDDTDRLCRVEVRPDGTVTATNGHLLISVKETYPEKPEDWPAKGFEQLHGEIDKPITINLEQLKRLKAGMPKRSTIPIVSCINVAQNGEGPVACSTDLQSPTILPVNDATAYPDWKRVIPASTVPHVEFSIAADVLEALAKAAKQARPGKDRKRPACVTFHIPTEEYARAKDSLTITSPVRIEIPSTEGVEIVGAVAGVMPK